MKPVRKNIYNDIKKILEQARNTAARAVNFTMVAAYWHIGKRIVEEEQKGKAKAGYGEYIIKNLASKLTNEFGKGFTETNLKYFRQFYLIFSGNKIRHAVRDQSQRKLLPAKVTQCVTNP